MNILIQDLDEWPAVATRAVWRGLLDCSDLTFRRAELRGDLIASGKTNLKLYKKPDILRWLGIQE
jgi:hypothetical protein